MSFMKSRDSQLMTEAEMVHGLRLAFDERVSTQFCLTEEEVRALLERYPAEFILQAFRITGEFLQDERENKLMFYTDDEIVNMIKENIVKEIGRAESALRNTSTRDLTDSHAARHRANRLAKIQAWKAQSQVAV